MRPGRWIEPGSQELADHYARDLRVVLHNDSVVVLHQAVLQSDTLIEVGVREADGARADRPRAIPLTEIADLERWQSGGERTLGGLLGAVAAFAALLYVWGRSVAS